MCSNGLPYLFLRVTLFDRYYFVIILPEEEAEDHRDSVIFPWSPSQERDHVGIWIQVLPVPKPSVLSLTPQTTTRWSRIQQLPNKIDALKDTRKRSPVSHSPLLPAPLIGTKRHLSALCTSKEEPAHPIPSQDEVPAGVWGMLMAMTWGRVCTNLLGICFPLSPLPFLTRPCLPLQQHAAFMSQLPWPGFSVPLKPLALLTRHRCSRASPCCPLQRRGFLCPEGPQVDGRLDCPISAQPPKDGKASKGKMIMSGPRRAVELWWISETEQGTQTRRSKTGCEWKPRAGEGPPKPSVNRQVSRV